MYREWQRQRGNIKENEDRYLEETMKRRFWNLNTNSNVTFATVNVWSGLR